MIFALIGIINHTLLSTIKAVTELLHVRVTASKTRVTASAI